MNSFALNISVPWCQNLVVILNNLLGLPMAVLQFAIDSCSVTFSFV